MNRITKIVYWALLGIVVLAGILALIVRVTDGLGITNLTQVVPWGLWVALYIYFIGLSAGSFLVSTLVYVGGIKRFEPIGRIAIFTAVIALLAGLLFILIDLGHMERFWTVFFNRNPNSVLAWEIHFYLIYMVILASELWLVMRRDLIRASREKRGIAGALYKVLSFGSKDLSELSAQADMRLVKILALIGIPIALAVHGGTGAIFAVVKARPYWYTGLFPLIFIVSALASGGALITFIAAFVSRMEDAARKEVVVSLGKLVAALLVVDLIFIGSEFLIGLYGAIPEHMATYTTIMFGPFWWVFWILQLGIGAVLPLLILVNRRTNTRLAWIGVAAAMIVVGVIGVRLNIVIPPLTRPLIDGFDAAYRPFTLAQSNSIVAALPALLAQADSARQDSTYFPSVIEWITSIGIIGLCVALFSLGKLIFPLDAVEDTSAHTSA